MAQKLAGRVGSYARWDLGGSGQWPKEADGGVAPKLAGRVNYDAR